VNTPRRCSGSAPKKKAVLGRLRLAVRGHRALRLEASAWVWSALTVLKLVPLLVLGAIFVLGQHAALASARRLQPLSWSRACS